MERIGKSQLPFIIKEALEHGEWKQEDVNPANETYRRGPRIITIGVKPTAEGEHVYKMENEASEMVINSKDGPSALGRKIAN